MIKIIDYNNSYKDSLERMLKELSLELFGVGDANIDDFVNHHWCIYLAVKDSDVIGFTSFVYNTYHGMRPPTVGNTYLYVMPEYRNTRATYLLSIQSGFISTSKNLPLENYYASDHSRKIARKLKGELAYETYIYEVDEVNRVFKHLINKIQIKE